MGYTTEHRGRRPKVVVPGTGQFLNSTCIRTNQSSEGIKYSAALTERIRRQRRNTRTMSVNYRPVSLTSVICKILETIIRDHMMDFLIKHKLINLSQHVFLKARSCLTILLCFFEEITKLANDGSPVDVTYLDFQKAFDKIPHQRLILKLKSYSRPCVKTFAFSKIEKNICHFSDHLTNLSMSSCSFFLPLV